VPAAVGGYDLTFSPVKSVSTLWAIADVPVAARIERAHQAAVAAALRFVEDRVGDQVIPLGCDHVIPQVVGPW
jgi:hypothetical protein